MEKLLKVLTDPVSNRILQMIKVRGKMTISDIMSENVQVPRATVYRKIEKMLDAGAIYIADSHKVRGQTENFYAIKEMYIVPKTDKDSRAVVTISLMQIVNQYERYFRNENADVNRDKLFLLNYAIPLTDDDFTSMTKEIFQIVEKYQNKETTSDAKLRSLYFLSAPGGEYNE
ncbi:MAG: helix-turn-helix domain-containing protein [Oscillospiraceae bacterium]|nr:helix-turn-helix domain-containing protein [Oscillospiraceae bacterium]